MTASRTAIAPETLAGWNHSALSEEGIQLLVALVDSDLIPLAMIASRPSKFSTTETDRSGAAVSKVFECHGVQADAIGHAFHVKVWTSRSLGRTSWKDP